MKKIKKRISFRVKNFNFSDEKITNWVDSRVTKQVEYEHDLRTTIFTPINPTEGLLKLNFKLQILPDIGEVKFNGVCIVESSFMKEIIHIMKTKGNKPFYDALNKLLLRRCFDHSKLIGEKNGMHFHSFDIVLRKYELDKVHFKYHDKMEETERE